MEYVPLGKTGMNVSRLSFGAIKLPDVDQQTASRVLHTALDLGINFVDTARVYGDSEIKIGKAIKHRKDEFFLATKTPKLDMQRAMEDIETSLRNLQVDCIDLYQLHNVSTPERFRAVMSEDGAIAALRKAREQGKIRHIGITIHQALDVMQEAIALGEFETIMLLINILDEEAVIDQVLPQAKEAGIGVIAMKALSGGKLVPPGADSNDPVVRGCLRYVLSLDTVHTALVGMKSEEEVRNNVAIAEEGGAMTKEERDELLRRIHERQGDLKRDYACLSCGYCKPCPEGINIPVILKARHIHEKYPEELRGLGRKLYDEQPVGPEACTECRTCVARCPAGLDIPAELSLAAEVFAKKTS